MSDFMDQFNDKQTQATFDSADVQKNKVVCILAYIPILFFIPYITDQNSNFCKFHANQGFIFTLLCCILFVISKILNVISIIDGILNYLIFIAMLVAMILLMISASQGKAVKIPVIGDAISIFH
ncbi:MAG: hypothetical protein LKG21_03650 [Ruminococcus sp.]|jgi:uncharacterized membrane protein|nr:hypothetical protein [Ruminococcus sp.]